VKVRGVPLGYVEDLNDARTLLADFFSILLQGPGRCPAETSWGGANSLCLFRADPLIRIVMTHA